VLLTGHFETGSLFSAPENLFATLSFSVVRLAEHFYAQAAVAVTPLNFSTEPLGDNFRVFGNPKVMKRKPADAESAGAFTDRFFLPERTHRIQSVVWSSKEKNGSPVSN
jgi:hypothetical protein